jgi:hypothetical protein
MNTLGKIYAENAADVEINPPKRRADARIWLFLTPRDLSIRATILLFVLMLFPRFLCCRPGFAASLEGALC